jgi:predicted porin
VSGKAWVSGISQKVRGLTNGLDATLPTTVGGAVVGIVPNTIVEANDRATSVDIGANVNVAGLGLTGYYYKGDGIGQTIQLRDGFDVNGKRRESDGYYVQATYVMPTKTKVGVSFGESRLDGNRVDDYKDVTDQMWTLGAYHPLTKHLNLVAEYSESERDRSNRGAVANAKAEAKTVSLGAILFF